MPAKSKTEMTTIAINTNNRDELNKMKRNFESYDDVLSRLFINQLDVETEVVSIDNELPRLHTLVLQLGEDKDSLYFFDGTKFEPISLQKANEMMKQPKPNLTVNREQAEIIYKNFLHIRRNEAEPSEAETVLHKQLTEFLGKK